MFPNHEFRMCRYCRGRGCRVFDEFFKHAGSMTHLRMIPPPEICSVCEGRGVLVEKTKLIESAIGIN